jgi:hypothetical protein
VDFQAQREALNATLDYLENRSLEAGNTNLIPRRFVWSYDARPFSFWPDLEGIWQDSILWATGHWVQGKLGNSTLGAIVAELFQSAGLSGSDYDVTRLTDTVEGFILSSPISVRNALEYLTTSFFFDVVESDGILKRVAMSPSKLCLKMISFHPRKKMCRMYWRSSGRRSWNCRSG